MTSASRPRARDATELAVAGVLVALAAFVLWQVQFIPADGGYSVIGPRFTPLVIGAGLLVVGLLLLAQAWTRGFTGLELASARDAADRAAFGWIVGGLVLQMAIIGVVGFTLASTALFAAVARGLGSRRTLRDTILGLALAAIVFLFFTRVLNLALPASPLRFV